MWIVGLVLLLLGLGIGIVTHSDKNEIAFSSVLGVSAFLLGLVLILYTPVTGDTIGVF